MDCSNLTSGIYPPEKIIMQSLAQLTLNSSLICGTASTDKVNHVHQDWPTATVVRILSRNVPINQLNQVNTELLYRHSRL